MKNLYVIGRILFAIPFGIFGVNHFLMTDVFAGMLSSFVPGGGFTVLLTGIALIAVCVSILINKYIKLSCLLLAALLLIFILLIHIPQLFDVTKSMMALQNLLKDTSLMGAALMIAGIYGNKESVS
jgi:putative oxidoreductase